MYVFHRTAPDSDNNENRDTADADSEEGVPEEKNDLLPQKFLGKPQIITKPITIKHGPVPKPGPSEPVPKPESTLKPKPIPNKIGSKENGDEDDGALEEVIKKTVVGKGVKLDLAVKIRVGVSVSASLSVGQ